METMENKDNKKDVKVDLDALEKEQPDEANTATNEEQEETKHLFLKQEETDQAHWYVVYTYSGYENKVMTNLEKTVENNGLEHMILDVQVPMEDTIEIKNGKRKHVQKKLYPGYVMVKMLLTDESWYVVRNTRGVTGFVGPGSKPIPLTDAEVRAMGVENVSIELDVTVGQNVMIIQGPLESFVGVVDEVNTDRQTIKVTVSMFGRDTSVELDFVQVKPINV